MGLVFAGMHPPVNLSELESLCRRQLRDARSIVVKIGTNVLADAGGGLHEPTLRGLVGEISELVRAGRRMLLVSSGAVASGMKVLGLRSRPEELAGVQAAAAIGQPALMGQYIRTFGEHGVPVAQILVTRDDFEDRRRYLAIRKTLEAVHAFGALPIINENDTISTAEIKFGDNDVLASLLAHAIRADVALFLTGTEGLLDAAGATVPAVADVREVVGLLKSSKSELGSGGMSSKLRWARAVSDAGDLSVIAGGRVPGVVHRVLEGCACGTVLIPRRLRVGGSKLNSRRRWIGLSARPVGEVVVDAGAARALRVGRRSLLPVGVLRVEGGFRAGQVVRVVDEAGAELGRGVCVYDAEHARRLAGLRSEAIRGLLGPHAKTELIHADSLVVEPDTVHSG